MFVPLPATHGTVAPFEDSNKAMCAEIQRDPYAHLMTNWEK